jgi:steroid delta-isomerase-like uncharacterized protein
MKAEINTEDKAAKIVGQLSEAWNRHDIESVVPLFSPNYEGMDISETAPRRGQQGAREWIERYWRAFPDMRFTEGQVVAQAERVAVRWTAQGTHRGRLLNIPPTGRTFTVRGVSFLTIKDGQIQRGDYIWDLAELLRCLRLLPELHEKDVKLD